MGSLPGVDRSPGAGHGNPLQYSYLENPMDRGAWQGRRESDTTGATYHVGTVSYGARISSHPLPWTSSILSHTFSLYTIHLKEIATITIFVKKKLTVMLPFNNRENHKIPSFSLWAMLWYLFSWF